VTGPQNKNGGIGNERERIVGLILALVIVLTGIMCQAAGKPVDYPNRPITLICPWAAGGSSDLTCRMISTLAPKYLGTTMNVVTARGEWSSSYNRGG